jgi:diacylglycerol kinase family enzyme
VSDDLETTVRALSSGGSRPIDVGFLKGGDYPEGRFFGNGIGVGFDTIVGFEAAKMKRIKGFAGYVIGALRTIFLFYHAPEISCRYGDVDRTEASIQISVMNGSRMGGTFHMAPEARIDDGELDLCIAGSPTRREMIGLIIRYLKGTQAESPHIRMGRTRAITIHSRDSGLAVHADGETICVSGSELEISCIPSALRIVTSADDTA